jgi:hypothetical protein
MVASACPVWRSKDIDAVDALRTEASGNRSCATIVARRSFKSISISESFSHIEVGGTEASRQQASVSIVIDIHEKNNLITGGLPSEELLDEVL